MKFLHTADWQVGMRATQLGEKGERVRHARLESARRVIEEGRREQVDFVVCALTFPPGLCRRRRQFLPGARPLRSIRKELVGENDHSMTVTARRSQHDETLLALDRP